jgi:hypothetical protein
MTKTDGSAFTLAEIIEIMDHAVKARRSDLTEKGGMRVSYFGPLCGAPITVLKDVERWVEMLKYTAAEFDKLTNSNILLRG